MPAGTVKIFKKCSPNGRVYLYLGNREFVSCDGSIKPITGVVNIQVQSVSVSISASFLVQDHHDTLKGRRIFAQLVITFRHGREEEEMMGLSFKKELVLDRVQIYPPEKNPIEETKLQSRLIQKLGEGAHPFALNFPDLAPNSVVICADDDEDPANVSRAGKQHDNQTSIFSFQRTMGVFYDVRVHLAENSDDFVGKKGTTVNMGIRKAQYAGLDVKQRSPTATTGLN